MFSMLLDEFMPEYHFHEVHRTTIRASAKRVLTLTKTLTPGDVPGFRQLAELRGLPARLAGRQGLRFANPRSIFEQALRAGFLLLAEVPNQELVLGWAGQFWKLWGGVMPRIDGAQQFLLFREPGFAKAAINFRVEPQSGGVILSTETRVYALDATVRRRMGVYWLLIRPGSGLIRQMWLRAIRRRAEGDESKDGIREPQVGAGKNHQKDART